MIMMRIETESYELFIIHTICPSLHLDRKANQN